MFLLGTLVTSKTKGIDGGKKIKKYSSLERGPGTIPIIMLESTLC
jgi:hypothetical protein